ncbi:hypothetical protein [Amycolatopsis sp. NBC_01286]|uniref:hypothetical protein n=1 Tax=Amycolatopsis sp. NBC_01286 TaxID=2903560 RepID=UPI002E130D74|nr:hypothetical protein OG570_16805 [Amycolatopsis sp. NBC_01286]
MAEKFGNPERAALFVLLLNGGEMKNPDLKNVHGIELSPAARGRLNKAELLLTQTESRPFVHRITPAGIDWCEHALADIETPPRSGGLAKAGFELLRRYVRHARAQGISLSVVIGDLGDPVDLETLIREAYWQLASRPQEFVRLAELRLKLNGSDRAEVDRTLLAMNRSEQAHLSPDSDRRNLTDDDHAAAIPIGREDNHLFAIEGS